MSVITDRRSESVITDRRSEIDGLHHKGISTFIDPDDVCVSQGDNCVYIPRAIWKCLVRDVATLIKLENAR